MGIEEVEEEIEVLRAIYGDEAVRVQTEAAAEGEVRLEVDLQPRVEQGAALVSVMLMVALPLGYPAEAAPKVNVERSRGLGDAALGSLLAAARHACSEHGLQEVGCVSQILDEVSEALDVANDTSECNICLLPCSPGEITVHTSCDHIFHSLCIGHWDLLKAAESEATASEASQSVRATRDALRREVDEVVCQAADTAAQLSEARDHAAKCAALVDVVRRRQAGGRQAEDLEIDAETAEALVDEEGEEIPLEDLVEKARIGKLEEKRLVSEERRGQGRLAEFERQLEGVETGLAIEAANRAAADLPCPVCRIPIARTLLPEAGSSSPAGQATDISPASVAALPQELQKEVHELQARHKLLLEKRRKKEVREAAEAASATPAAMTPPPPDGAAPELPRVAVEEPDRRSQAAGAKGYSKASASNNGHRKAPLPSHASTGTAAATTTASRGWDQDWSADHKSQRCAGTPVTTTTASWGWDQAWSAGDYSQGSGRWGSSRAGADAGQWSGQGGGNDGRSGSSKAGADAGQWSGQGGGGGTSGSGGGRWNRAKK